MFRNGLMCGSKVRRLHLTTVLLTSTAISMVASPAMAQNQDGAAADDENTIIVTGTRATIRNSIETKRIETEIVDALSSEEIGDLPALSIGEALETLTGAASHTENGGATEISIRGLGPFLGSTTINGRAAANGSGDRSVNFNQFPSELFTKVSIYKTQSARLIEGGVSGQIQLESIRPVDHGKRSIQGEFKLNINPDNLDIAPDQRFNKFGYRGTVSYIDQFQLGDGELGISLGYSRVLSSAPEQEARVSDTVNYCANGLANAANNSGVFDDNNCTTNSPRPAIDDGTPFVAGRNGYTLRQNITEDERDSFFAALQLKPSDNFDLNFDFQYSKRIQTTNQNDLNFSEGRRVDGLNDTNIGGGVAGFPLIVGDFGNLQQFTSEGRIETNSALQERSETFYGGGIALDIQASDRLKLSFNASYNETQRTELGLETRLRNDRFDIFGNDSGFGPTEDSEGGTERDRTELAIMVAQNGSQALNFVTQNFDVNNHDLFADDARIRIDLDQNRFNSIWAARGDVEYELDGFISSIQAGIRFQDLKYRETPDNRFTQTLNLNNNQDAIQAASQACRTDFPESGFLSSVSGGNPLVTNVDETGNVISTTNSFATFNPVCLVNTLISASGSTVFELDENGTPIFPEGNAMTVGSTNVQEDTWAGYVQANFDGDLGGLPVRGNVGLRVINTEVNSTGFRGTLSVVRDPITNEITNIVEDGSALIPVTGGGSYTKYLPSFNVVADVANDVQARFAVYRALSRPDPASLGFGRTFGTLVDDGNPVFDVADAVATANATGNPFQDPLMSWNFDAAVEWYPNSDTILAAGAYYKSFNGGFETVGQVEAFDVDGQQLSTLVTTVNTSDETSKIYGFELTAAHRLSYLPAPFDGLGFKLSYNFASSNFDFQDNVLGAISTVNPDGSTTVTQEALIPPAEIFGLSKHVLSAQAYYQIGDLDIQGIYKYRSRYFQQFVGSNSGRVRYTDDKNQFEARISYKLTPNIRLSIEGLNLFNNPRTDFRPTVGNLAQKLVYGPRYFFGVRAKF